ncbi:helix-turn-helix transcriptional regulator [Tritonibacter mobilis]|nr:helix-turn-helix transcriptional regulator [Tritonibacter mobilis]
MAENLQRNLKLLTSHFKSVAEVCRQLDINRSQFNKYLNGTSRPSQHALSKICDFFGVEESEILQPHEDFAKLVRLRRDANVGPLAYSAYLEHLAKRSRRDLSRYDGFYHEYSYCMTYPGKILRTLVRLSTEGGVTRYSRIENMAIKGEDETRVRGRYNGLAFYLNDRIFQVDFDAITGEEISQTILYPNFKNRNNRLPGLKLGVSTSCSREPLCARVLYCFLGKKIKIRDALKACAVFSPDDPEIDSAIERTVRNSMGDEDKHFRVMNSS